MVEAINQTGKPIVVVLINGHHCLPDCVLEEGDSLSAFPAMAGG